MTVSTGQWQYNSASTAQPGDSIAGDSIANAADGICSNTQRAATAAVKAMTATATWPVSQPVSQPTADQHAQLSFAGTGPVLLLKPVDGWFGCSNPQWATLVDAAMPRKERYLAKKREG